MRNYPEGLDCIWLAYDSADNVGAFITAGLGPLPAQSLSADLDIELAEEEILSLPERGAATLLIQVKRPDDYLNLAARGLYVYDWTDIGRVAKAEINAYELVAVPDAPLLKQELPQILQNYAVGLIRFSGFCDRPSRIHVGAKTGVGFAP